MQSESLRNEANKVLEWTRLLDALASHAHSSRGARYCRSLTLEEDLVRAQKRLAETTEAAVLRESTDPLPTLQFPDIEEALGRVSKGASLEILELRDAGLVLALLEEVHRYLSRHRQDAPTLAELLHRLGQAGEWRRLKGAINAAINADGSMKESASQDLRRFMHQANDLKQQMRHRLDQILQSQRYAEVLQEQYFAQREGRYVVPIKADMQGRVPGIVHDVSASGATVFLEPRELVDLNNGIKVADLEVEREVRRILRSLSEALAPEADRLTAALAVLAEFDAISAKAALSHQLQAEAPRLTDNGRIMLQRARHPLLVLAKEQVVANDIDFDEHIRVLIVSGPNTGGKTVVLKLLGLYALMVRCGLHLPCGPDSDMALFDAVYADIGDSQDLARDLSSFSAHMTQMVKLLAEVEPRRNGNCQPSAKGAVLVLLDEPVTSTDPAEGAALASSLLCRLADIGAKVVATTHYSVMKGLAQETPGFANASVEFNLETLAPTYRLVQGQPGGSAAIEIAGRLGMDEAILADARRRLQGETRLLETLLTDVQERHRRVTDELASAAIARQEADAAAKEAQELLTSLQDSEREERKGLKKKLTQEFQRARAAVQATLDELKRDQKIVKARETKSRLVELEAEVRRDVGEPQAPIPVEALTIGDAVEVTALGMSGVLLEDPRGKKRVRVRVGEGEISASVAGLTGVARAVATETGTQKVEKQATAPRRNSHTLAPEDIQETLDVRGQAADEAVDALVAVLDRATLGGSPYVRIIHGHGTGRLRNALREYLKDSPYVATFRSGDRAEGVTV
ncbi:MAG: endonuclease MutS2 [Nitrospiraceae bacterium]